MLNKKDKLYSQTINNFIEAIKAGKDKEIARAITLLENRDPLSREIMKKLYENFSKPYIIGITGPAGSGKSSMLNLMLKKWLKKYPENKIAVIAVDPSSQKSGGAFLGDRIRMKDLINDQRVFIRSMASRGNTGGVNPAVYDTAVILAAAGYQKIIIETVGVGQNEIDIVNLSDTTLVVTVPDTGDEIQIFKSELMEVGDIFILNKSDLPQADRMEIIIKSLFSLKNSGNSSLYEDDQDTKAWESLLVKTSALYKKGISDLITQIENHFTYLKENNLFLKKQKLQLKEHLFNLLKSEITRKLVQDFGQNRELDEQIEEILSGKSSPYQLVERFIDKNLTI